jgi:hypothetical protein
LAISNSELGAQELFAALTGESGALALDYLEDIDSRTPTRTEAQILKKTLAQIKNPVLAFQIKKSLRLAAFRLKKAKFQVSIAGMEKLLKDNSRLDDLALAITTVESAEAFLAADLIRQAHWETFPAEILPSFCTFFKKHGSIEDSNALQELARHPEPIVITAALTALEKIDPSNLQSIIIPLLDSPQNGIKAQAIQTFYRYNKHQALKHLLSMLFSKDEKQIILALHHATYFPFQELESQLIRLMTECSSPPVLMRISQIFKNNANTQLPFRLFWVNRSIDGQHKSLVKGIILGVVRALADKKLIDVSTQEYLEQLKEKVRKEELERLKKSCHFEEETEGDEGLPSISTIEKKKSSTDTKPDTKPKPTESNSNFDNYDSLKEKEKVQLLNRLKPEEFQNFRAKIEQLFTTAKGKELAAIIGLFGKHGKPEDAEKIKPCFKKDNPDVVCASIKAMAKLDQDYLCLFLPQFMQDKNGKVRMTATRSLVSIDRESIRSLLSGLLSARSSQQRALGISTSMLVDFNIVREPLIKCLGKESSVELLEKIGMVLSANPDRELLLSAYATYREGRSTLKAEYLRVTEMIADKLSIVLNKINSPEELLAEAEEIYDSEYESRKDKIAEEKKRKEEELKEMEEAGVTIDQLNTEDQSLQTILSAKSKDPKITRAKATIIIWILVAVAWGGTIALLILKVLTGE